MAAESADDHDRPRCHLVPRSGWLNDPLGVVWHDQRYDLYVQSVPNSTAWASDCRWGRATSPDLVRWRPAGQALEPGPAETGCWTGSVVADADGPVAIYTSVAEPDLGLGRIAVATGTWERFGPGTVTLGAPPDATIFRDPFVWRDGDGWRMVVGAGLTDGTAALPGYSSPDLRTWEYDGIVASRAGGPGSMWECPQLFPLDGAWVLLVSNWRDDRLLGVEYAVGTFDGARFQTGPWRPFGHGDALYATTTFDDADGCRGAISWLRELEPLPSERTWAGALSLPWRLGRDGDRVVVQPHPDVMTLREAELVGGAQAPSPILIELATQLPPGGMVRCTLTSSVAVTLDATRDVLVVTRPGRADVIAPLGARNGETTVQVVLDGSVLEAFPASGEPVAVRVVGAAVVEPDLTTSGGATVALRTWSLEPAIGQR